MVLSMSTRLAWRLQSLIVSSQFVKQKEQGKVERGDGMTKLKQGNEADIFQEAKNVRKKEFQW